MQYFFHQCHQMVSVHFNGYVVKVFVSYQKHHLSLYSNGSNMQIVLHVLTFDVQVHVVVCMLACVMFTISLVDNSNDSKPVQSMLC